MILDRTLPFALSLCLVGVCMPSAQAKSPPMLKLPFHTGEGWTFEGSGPYEGWADRRDLFVLHHPWEESQTGQAGTVVREATVPADWDGRVRLHFYMTDDYQGEGAKLDEDNWLGQMALIAHRFKQALVDDEIVWERDVADPEGVSEPSRFSVLLPPRVKPGDRVRIAFRLLDRVGSDQRLEGDYRHIGTTDGIEPSDPWRFMTHLYVGDVALTPESIDEISKGELPSAAKARAVHAERWPLEPYGEDVNFPVPLTWEGFEQTSRVTHAVRCGVPLPAGRAREVDQVMLRNAAGELLPSQAQVMNTWPDGTLRWIELDALVRATDATGDGHLWLDLADGEEIPAPEHPVSVTAEQSQRFILSTGEQQVAIGGERGVLIGHVAHGDAEVSNLSGEIQVGDQIYLTVVDSAQVLADGPVRAEVELTGTLQSAEDEIGRFVFRVAVMAGQPYLRMNWRIFNDRPTPLEVSRFELIGACSLSEQAVCRWGAGEQSASGRVLLRQSGEDSFEVLGADGAELDSGESTTGWIGAVDARHSLMLHVRHFRQQFPKALEWKPGAFRISLFEASDAKPHYVPSEGEAKRHEIWLALWNRRLTSQELAEAGRSLSRPARLFSAGYFCASGGFGYAAPHNDEQFADLDAYMRETYRDIEASRFYERGIRNWGDHPYRREENTWCNGYYDRPQGFASEYLMSGDPRWFDRLEATVRHIIDVDVCHASEQHPEQVGAIYSCYSVNHNQGGIWVMMQRTKGLLAYWRLTGDRDAREAALGAADFVIRTNAGLGRGSVRDHGGALYCLMAAYDETREERYLEAARQVAHDAMGRIDPRRGCYAEVHGNISYRGNVPWMVAQLAQPIYEYYRASGDVDAAVAVIGMAESILTENRTRGVPGDVYGYSHNPHFKKTSGYHVLIAPAVLYGYELTGDAFFIEQGRAMYHQTIQEKSVNAINNCYWNVPTLLYYLLTGRE